MSLLYGCLLWNTKEDPLKNISIQTALTSIEWMKKYRSQNILFIQVIEV